jgi:cell division protease FtsH
MLAPMRSTRFWITLAILFAANIVISNLFFSAGQQPTVTISYNTFLEQVNAGNVVSITSTGEAIAGNTKAPVKDTSSGQTSTKFQTQRPAFATDNLLALLQEHNVTINAKDPNAATPLWETLLFSFGPRIPVSVAPRRVRGRRRDPRQLRPEQGARLRRGTPRRHFQRRRRHR